MIPGESGSGKTEAARIVLQFLVLVSGDYAEIKLMKDRLVQANTLLEAFGNARTMKNDNASRFVYNGIISIIPYKDKLYFRGSFWILSLIIKEIQLVDI